MLHHRTLNVRPEAADEPDEERGGEGEGAQQEEEGGRQRARHQLHQAPAAEEEGLTKQATKFVGVSAIVNPYSSPSSGPIRSSSMRPQAAGEGHAEKAARTG